jgi:hypothetical protein
VYGNLDEKKERDDGTWVLDAGVTNHMTGYQAAFMKLDMMLLDTVHFGDNLVERIKGRGTAMFVCKNGESHSLEGVYFIPRLATNNMSIEQLNEVGYKINIDTGKMKI